MNGSRSYRQPTGMGGPGGPPPRDLVILLAVIFVTFSVAILMPGALSLLRLTPAAWQAGFVWQLGTYAFIGFGSPSLWFLLELLILFWFGRDVYRFLGRRDFWSLLAWGIVSASVAAVAVHVLINMAGFAESPATFFLMQGQRILLTIMIAAFATVYGHATIMLFFVLPIQAKWFLGLEILFAFMGFLGTRDLPGFVGICVAVGVVYTSLRGGGVRKLLREWRLRIEKTVLEARLRNQRDKKGFRVIKGGQGRGGNGSADREPWVN